jgi:hypothetical protein
MLDSSAEGVRTKTRVDGVTRHEGSAAGDVHAVGPLRTLGISWLTRACVARAEVVGWPAALMSSGPDFVRPSSFTSLSRPPHALGRERPCCACNEHRRPTHLKPPRRWNVQSNDASRIRNASICDVDCRFPGARLERFDGNVGFGLARGCAIGERLSDAAQRWPSAQALPRQTTELPLTTGSFLGTLNKPTEHRNRCVCIRRRGPRRGGSASAADRWTARVVSGSGAWHQVESRICAYEVAGDSGMATTLIVSRNRRASGT